MGLLEGEKKILESDTGQFVLTSHRAKFFAQKWGRAVQTTILLEDLDSCDIEYRSKPIFIILGIIIFLVSLMSRDSQYRTIGIVLGIVFAAIFFFSRKSIIVLKSRSNKIALNTIGMKMDTIQEVINEVEKAKIQRRETLSRNK